MPILLAALVLLGLIPLGRALWVNRATSLLHALVWTTIAWLMWGLASLLEDESAMAPARYCALCLTGCAGVAVLGARRPHVFAWNFVVLGLFAVMVLPLVESSIIGTHSLDGLRLFFMIGTIAVGIVNYVPTRLAPVAVMLAFICAGEMIRLQAPERYAYFKEKRPIDFEFTLTPWLAWLCLRSRKSDVSEFDRLWLDFRDRWGLVWSQRVREQFNNAAENAGLAVNLAWRGLRHEDKSPADQERLLELLRATLQRFIAADQNL